MLPPCFNQSANIFRKAASAKADPGKQERRTDARIGSKALTDHVDVRADLLAEIRNFVHEGNARGEESGVQPNTVFFPIHRIEKIILDEGIGAIPSLSDTFLTKVGSGIEQHLESE